ncbi:MAG: hypothetical protein ACI91J_002458, partial [Yoonia sp.]
MRSVLTFCLASLMVSSLPAFAQQAGQARKARPA